MAEPAAGQGRYLFAVTRGVDEQQLQDTSGLRGAPLEVVPHRELQALVCTVDLEDFGEAALARNLEDLAWLEEVARGHHDVVFAAATHGTVAPMRLVTICADDESVRQRIEDSYDALCTALDRVEGRLEWSVKAYGARSAAVPEATATSGGGAGAAYLQRKRDQAAHRRLAAERSVQVAEEIHHALVSLAVAGRRLAPQDPRLSGRTDPMILNAAFLVTSEEGEAFRAEVARLAELHPDVTVEVEGPWPPYSFATLD